MAKLRPDRRLPDQYFPDFIGCVEQEIGDYSLRMILKNADLGIWRPESASPPSDVKAAASDIAQLQHSLREYYGSGARGILNRAGRGMWQMMVEGSSTSQKAALKVIRQFPRQVSRVRVLEYLAERMGGQSGQSFVYPLDPNLIFVDHFSDPTYGQQAKEPICWSTVGMIQAALHWAAGLEHAVEEISCRALGDKSCRFEIWQ